MLENTKRKPFLQRFKYLFGQQTPDQQKILIRTRQRLIEIHTEAALEYAKTVEDFFFGLHLYVTAFSLDSTTAAMVKQAATYQHFCCENT